MRHLKLVFLEKLNENYKDFLIRQNQTYECGFSNYEWEKNDSLDEFKQKTINRINAFYDSLLDNLCDVKRLEALDQRVKEQKIQVNEFTDELDYKHDVKYCRINTEKGLYLKKEDASFELRLDLMKKSIEFRRSIDLLEFEDFLDTLIPEYDYFRKLITEQQCKYTCLILESIECDLKKEPTIIKLKDFNVWEYGHKRDNILIIEKE